MRFVLALLVFFTLGFAPGASIHATLEFTQPKALDVEGYETLEGNVQMEWTLYTESLRILTPADDNAIRVELINPIATVDYEGGYILEGVKDRLCTERVREYAHYTQPYAPPYNETIRLLLFQNGSYRVEGIFVADIAIEAQETCEENIVQDETLTENRPFDMDMQGEYSSTAQTLEGNGEFTNAAGFGALEPSNNWEVEWKFEFEKTPQEIAEESGQVNATTTASTPEESKPGEEAAPEENNTRLILVGVAVLIILLYLYLEKKEEA